MHYYVIEIKQLLSDNTNNFEVVYNPGKEDEFAVPVQFFALCDLREQACQGKDNQQLEDFIGVILPVTFDEEEGMEAILTSEYKPPSEQEVRLREKAKLNSRR